MIGHQQGSGFGEVLEEGEGDLLFPRPGVGEDEVEVVHLEAHVLISGATALQPVGIGDGVRQGLAVRRHEAADVELGRELVIRGQEFGLLRQLAVDLDPEGFVVQPARHARHHAEAAAPLEELLPGDEASFA